MFRSALSVGFVLLGLGYLGRGEGDNADKSHSNCNFCS